MSKTFSNFFKIFLFIIIVFITLEIFPTINVSALTVTQQKELDTAVDKIMESITPDMNDFEKVYTIYFSFYAKYDRSLSKPNAYNAYGALVNKCAVCEGFSEAVKLLLDKAGIENFIQTGTSNGDGHGWNMVKVYDKWYHIDKTNDLFLVLDNDLPYKWEKVVTTPSKSLFAPLDARFMSHEIIEHRLLFSSNVGYSYLGYYDTINNKTVVISDAVESLDPWNNYVFYYDNKKHKIMRYEIKNNKNKTILSLQHNFYFRELYAIDKNVLIYSDYDNIYIHNSLKNETFTLKDITSFRVVSAINNYIIIEINDYDNDLIFLSSINTDNGHIEKCRIKDELNNLCISNGKIPATTYVNGESIESSTYYVTPIKYNNKVYMYTKYDIFYFDSTKNKFGKLKRPSDVIKSNNFAREQTIECIGIIEKDDGVYLAFGIVGNDKDIKKMRKIK